MKNSVENTITFRSSVVAFDNTLNILRLINSTRNSSILISDILFRFINEREINKIKILNFNNALQK